MGGLFMRKNEMHQSKLPPHNKDLNKEIDKKLKNKKNRDFFRDLNNIFDNLQYFYNILNTHLKFHSYIKQELDAFGQKLIEDLTDLKNCSGNLDEKINKLIAYYQNNALDFDKMFYALYKS